VTVALRTATDADRPFLEALYAEARADELAFTTLDDAAKAALCKQQFEAQDRSYRQQFPDAAFDVVLVDGEAKGRLIVDRSDVWHVVDIVLSASGRGAGVGTALLRALTEEAKRAGCDVTLTAATSNPARRLYERLGFVAVSSDDVYVAYRLSAQANTAS
jgi:ribosomal protein S18 acetylase RimI-like enzyme